MRDLARWQRVGLGAVVVLTALFAYFNSGERVALSLGIFDFYQVSLVVLILVAFLAGMLAMFLIGLGHDAKVRRALHERGFDVPPAPAPRPLLTAREERPAYEGQQGYEYDPTPAREAPAAPPFPPYPPPDPEP